MPRAIKSIMSEPTNGCSVDELDYMLRLNLMLKECITWNDR